MFHDRAANLFKQCEQGLRALMAEAGAAGDYDAAETIMFWARALASLKDQAAPSTPAPSSDRGVPAPCEPHRGRVDAVVPNAPVPARELRRAAPGAAAPYPRFFRRGDELVKVGWSKKGRKEYHHRAPRRAVDLLAAAVQRAGRAGKVFTAEAILPLQQPPSPQGRGQGEGSAPQSGGGGDPDAGPIPDYQAYLALAWLKCLGLVIHHGRTGGYTLASDNQLDSAISSAWASLSERRG